MTRTAWFAVALAVAAGAPNPAGAAPMLTLSTTADLSTVYPARLSAAGDAIGAMTARWAYRWGQVAYRSIPFSPCSWR